MKRFALILATALMAVAACSKASNEGAADTSTATTAILPEGYAKGADIGWLSEMEAAGCKFYTSKGQEMDCIDVLKSQGINSIRLRVWVNPKDGYCNKADVLAMATRAKNKGMRLMIDFHYSDWWADPGKQNKPAAWVNMDIDALKKALYDHTFDVLTTLKNAGITPEWVQVGNEVDDGFLWPTGQPSKGNGANYAALINSGYDAVKAVDQNIKVIVHVSNGNKNDLFRWNFDTLVSNGGKFDIMGMSVYPDVATWTTYMANLQANMTDMVQRYHKPIMICEVGMDVAAPQAAKDMLTALMNKNAALGANGLGVFWWEPQAYNWKNYNKVAFDNSGKPTVAMDAFLMK